MTTYKVKTADGWEYIDSSNYDSRYVLASIVGENDGVCPLDESGKIFSTYLPASITGAVTYKGVFDASTATAPTPAAQGYYYVCNVSGTISSVSFATGDWLVYKDTSNWDKIGNSSASVTWSRVTDKPSTFAPSSHGNESHSSTFITSSGVTYEALNTNGDVGSGSGQIADGQHTHSDLQPLDADLSAIAGLSGTSGLLKKTAANTWELDTNSYVTTLGTASNSTLWDTMALPSGTALQYIRRNAANNALECATVEATGNFLGLSDTPSSYSGSGGYFVKVNSGGTALEFATVSASAATGFINRTLEGVVYETTMMYWVAPASCTISSASMSLTSAPSATGTYCKVQVMKNGLLETDSIFSSDQPMQITETTVASNGVYSASGTLDSNRISLAVGDVIQFRVNQADTGSADLLVQMKVTFT